jgi:hypothetical protein
MSPKLIKNALLNYPRERLRLITLDQGYYDLGAQEIASVTCDYESAVGDVVLRFTYELPRGLVLEMSPDAIARLIIMPPDASTGAVPPDLDGPQGWREPS